ncbi:MAG: hypothetical protein OHK0026_12950 [Rhodocyclaceae bacterium]
MLGRGALRRAPGADLHHWLAAAYGLAEGETPWGALRLGGEGIDPGQATWMCMDPVHLRVLRDRFVVAGDDELALDAAEAASLVASLDREFAPRLRFSATDPAHWYARIEGSPALLTQPLARVLGRRPDPALPRGPDARAWMRHVNDIQVALHHHPVNEAREASGRLAINSVWPWGCGRWPRIARRAADTVAAGEPLARGLALASGGRAIPLPANAGALPGAAGESVLVLLDTLHAPSLYRDAAAWRGRLAELGREWFDPLDEQVARGRISRLALVGLSDEGCIELEYGRSARRRLWRSPLPLYALTLARPQT